MSGKASRRIGKQDQAERKQRFEEEVLRLMDRLYGTALRLTRNTDDAEDIVAEAVSKAWSRLDELDDLDCLPGWLFRILNNVFVSEWRKRQTRQRYWEDAKQAGDIDAPEDFSLFQKLHQPFLLWWGTPEDAFVNDLLHEDIQRALDSLPDEYRVVIVLVEVQGYTYSEASRLLEVPTGTIRSRLSRARSLLQKALWTQACAAGLRSEPGDSGHDNGAGK
ncbi:MAG: sigma-70 family RNA polymerase sigma factor [Ectothiorhodospiraceae bacterium]|nr:sigma-70 family RNA polymerase sigma factor [Ectothiorhodospiraceae bacterium]